MDSGMQVNIINSNLFKDKQIHSVMLVDPTRVTSLSGVAGSNVLVRGQIYLAFSTVIDQIKFPGDLVGYTSMCDLQIVLYPFQWHA